MKKLLLLMVAGVMAVMTSSAATWSSAPTSASGWDAVMSPSSSTTTIAPTTWKDSSASPDVAWSLDYTWQTDGKVYYSRGKNGLQFGSGSAGVKGMTISSEDFSGTISKVTLKGAKSNGSAKISVKVGESEFTINGSQSKTLLTTAADCEFTGNGSGKIEIILSDNANGKYIGFTGLEVVYEESFVTPTLGDITVTYGANATPVVQDETLEGIVEGTVFTFSAENAESIIVTNSENTTIAQGFTTAEWTATVTEGEELTVTAKLGDAQKTFSFMVEVVEAPKPVLGDIVVTYGDGINVENGTLEGLSVQTGTTFYISATNATHISAERWSDETVVVDVDSDNTSWTFNEVQEMEGLTITATNGVDTKTFEFLLEITEAPKPVLGNLVVTYGDGIQVNEDDEISVEVGTTFTFSAENATNIKVESFMESLVVVNENANSATWIPESAFEQDGFTVTATDGTDSKTLTFLLTVTEPVVPEDEIWTLVTSSDNFVVGGKYIIANNDGTQAMSNKNNANYRLITSVNVEDNIIKNPSESVLRLTVEKDGDDYFWKTINYLSTAGNIASPQVYLNVGSGNSNYLNATNPNEGNEDRRNTSVAFDGDNVLITFVNALFKTGPEKRRIFFNNDRFATYGDTNTNMGKVKLYKLVEPQPEVPTFDQMEEVATKVSMTSTKGELHVWTMEYDKDGKLVKENGEEMPVSIMAKAPADDKTWTNKVADEGVTYEIDVPTTDGNYLTIRAKSVLNGLHSEELIKNVDASGNVISGVESVVADDENAPVEYFNLQGVRVAADQPGIYIRRQGSNVEKVSIAR